MSTLEQNISAYQRGFTANTSPLHAALIVEEVARECKDIGTPVDMVILDAKAVFDVVDHQHLLRCVYHSGIKDRHWSIINSIHTNAQSVVKWADSRSEPFPVLQGVRQGGILSTDLYKIYVNPLLKRLESTDHGCTIGDIKCNASACADEITINSTNSQETKVLTSMAEDFANCERYILQPTKSEALKVLQRDSKSPNTDNFEIYCKQITNSKVSTHLGLKRSVTIRSSAEENVDNNIQKARRSVYSFMSTGFHGAGGLDIPTMLHIMKVFVIPILLYGLEVILPRQTLMDKLELCQKRILKQLFSIAT
ncbi:hypothetical protein DPMN_053811 [Dreissena polymorpha]|uniref:Reverse transcriptase domain-containing protein n=1 Tax=Dreissena polymorpha TaxID=45954 RepID=A0A9D4CPH6_DREPO|nr:hypothetical protein DPMN_053811 [Dreissena polymorpha]